MKISEKKLRKLENKEYRHSYLRELSTGWIVHQIRALRDQRGWSQARLGKESGKAQSAIARIEDPSYGKWNLNTLLELAEAFDVALEVRFTDWPRCVQWSGDTSPQAMQVNSFDLTAFSPVQKSGPETAEAQNVVVLSLVQRRPECILDPADRLRLRSEQGNIIAGATNSVKFEGLPEQVKVQF